MDVWVDVLMYTAGVDPREVETEVLIKHFEGTGLIALERRRLEDGRALFFQSHGFFTYQIRVKQVEGES